MRDDLNVLMFASLLLIAMGVVVITTGCMEYDLDSYAEPPADPPEEPEEPDDPPDDPPDDEWVLDPDEPILDVPEIEEDPPVEEDPPEEDLPDCDDTIIADWQWWGSMPFGYEWDPTDGNGLPFYDPWYTMIDYSTVSMPDSGHVPSGYDKVYRATFEVNQMPPALFLSMQSDDGMSFFLNGHKVGEWGYGWQAEGCVNDNAGCSESVTVPPVDVTSFLVVGTNTAAARVSNAIDNSYFEVFTECVD